VPADVDKVLRGESPADGLPPGLVAAVLGRFLAGHSLTVSRKMTKKRKGVDLEQLENLPESWALCVRRPPPGWRLFGRFLECDVLVIFRVYHREDIGAGYQKVAADIRSDWDTYLKDLPWVQSDRLEDYISGSHYNVDAQDN